MARARASLLVLVVAAVSCVRGDSEVTETTSSYSCCDLALKFNPGCENVWIIDGKPIGYSKGQRRQCVAPCKSIGDGLMELFECVRVNVSTVCTEKRISVEKRICYLGQPCHPAATATGSQVVATGSFALLVVTAMLISYRILDL